MVNRGGGSSLLCLATLTGKLHKRAKNSSRSLHRENVHVLCLQYWSCSPSSVGVGLDLAGRTRKSAKSSKEVDTSGVPLSAPNISRQREPSYQ